MLIFLPVFITGASLASFAGLCFTRLATGKKLSSPGSSCDNCGRRLGFLRLLPVFGWLLPCRRCHTRASLLYPLSELLSGAIAVALLLALSHPGDAIRLFVFIFFALTISLLDWKTGEVFPALTIPGICIGLLLSLPDGQLSMMQSFPGAVGGWLFFYLVRKISRGGMGLGDADFAALCGAFLGWKMLICGMVSGFLIGGLWAGFMLATAKKGRKAGVPFTPFLASGMAVALFSGNWLFRFYLL